MSTSNLGRSNPLAKLVVVLTTAGPHVVREVIAAPVFSAAGHERIPAGSDGASALQSVGKDWDRRAWSEGVAGVTQRS